MKALILAVLLIGSFSAQASVSASHSSVEVMAKKKSKKSEPAPPEDERKGGEEEVDPRLETYEGNDRDGGGSSWCTFDCDTGGSGGMIGTAGQFSASGKAPTTNTRVEDGGDVLVYITTIQEDVSEVESCITTVINVIDKATGIRVKSDSDRMCTVLSM